jgi:hypothetical protein
VAGDVGQSIVLALLAAVIVWPALFSGGILLGLDIGGASLPWGNLPNFATPHNGTLSDTLAQYYPWRHFLYDALRAGEWPLWNPYILAGHPTFASINEQVFYPPSDLLFPFPAEQTFGWLAWLHLSLAGIGTRLFATTHFEDDASACLAGITFMLGGPLIVWLEYPPFLSTLGWAGLLFYFLERLLRDGRPLYAALTGVIIGLELLGGQAQYSLYLALLAVVYTIVRLMSLARKNKRSVIWSFANLSLATAIGGGLGAIAYVPAIEFVLQSNRIPLDLDQLLATALPLKNLVTFALPNAFGSPVRNDFVGFFNYNETTAYVGLLPVLLVVLAPLARPRGSAVVTFGVTIAATLLLVFGWQPAVQLLWSPAPFRFFGLNRLVAILPFAIGIVGAATYSALPAVGAARWRRTAGILVAILAFAVAVSQISRLQSQVTGSTTFAQRDLTIALFILAAAAVALVTRVWLPRGSTFRWLGPAIVAFDLLIFGAGYNTILTPNPFAGPPTPPLGQVAAGPLVGRTVGLPIEKWILAPNLGMLWNISTPDGYVSEYVRHYGTFASHASPVNREPTMNALHPGGNYVNFGQILPRYLALLGVRYVLSPPNPEVPDVLRLGHDAESDPVAGQASVGETFQARQNGLNRIDVFPVLHGRGVPSWIALHLTASPTDATHIAYVRLEGATIADSRPLTFWFKPISDSAGREFYFYVDAPEAQQATAVRLEERRGAHATGEQRFVDGRPADGALAFAAYAAPTASWPKLGEANGVAVYENPDALPRAFVVHRIASLTDEQFYAGLDRGSLDPGRVAAVTRPPPAELAAALLDASGSTTTTVNVTSAKLDEIDLQAELSRPGLLVVSNVWYPGWQAMVDGEPTSIERVDAVFQGVYLPAGEHRIRLVFEPASLRIGLALAGFAAILAVGAIVADRRRPPP